MKSANLNSIQERLGLNDKTFSLLFEIPRSEWQKYKKGEKELSETVRKNICHFCNLEGRFLSDDCIELPKNIVVRKELKKARYRNILSAYIDVLKEYFGSHWQIYSLVKSRKKTTWSFIKDFFTGGTSSINNEFTDFTPYYLVERDGIKLLVHVKNWILEIYELSPTINMNFFKCEKRFFKNVGLVKFKN